MRYPRNNSNNHMHQLDQRIFKEWQQADERMMALLRMHEARILQHVRQHNIVVDHHHRHNLYVHPDGMRAAHPLRRRF